MAQEDSSDNSVQINVKDTFHFLSTEHIHGKFRPNSCVEFSLVDSQYCYKEIYLLTEVYEAFLTMAEVAAKDSIELKIISGLRSFNHQRGLWENKWTGKTKVMGQKLNITFKDQLSRAKKILEYTAPPGFSRHHWGTDLDLNSVEEEYFETEEGIKVFSWLKKNATQFGFCQTYNSLDHRNHKGFNEEKWHWSYSKLSEPILSELLNTYNTSDIKDFKGSLSVRKLNLLQDYILSINRCQ